MIESPYRVRPGKTLRLSTVDTAECGRFKNKEAGEKAWQENLERLDALQEVLYAEAKHAVLIVFQAMDAGGKDGAIEHVFSGVNPQGCTVTGFRVPTPQELSHDYLWRIHAHVPPKGMIGIFNRSHYESVLVERVKELVPKEVWSRRFDHINAFEKLLTDEGVTILKFFLHISKEEQKERLQARLDDPTKRWKFNPKDLDERKRWDHYMAAFEEALNRCSTPYAPWFVVPADRKWFRNWVVSDTLVRTLEALDMTYPPAPEGVEKMRIT